MSYVATVLRVMIASPSDTLEARDAVESAIHGWNDTNARSKQVILQPWRWESCAVPLLGGHPQTLINAQGVDDSDVVFAIFGSRLGAPTPDAVSGTVAEIERAVQQAKPVHLYFSTAPLPNNIDIEQLEGLRAFKSEIQQRGLFGEFGNTSQLGHEVWKAIEHDLVSLALGAPVLSSQVTGVKFLAQPQQERELSGSTSKGAPRYKTRHWLEVTNAGSQDATEVTFEVVGDSPSMMIMSNAAPTTIHAGQTRRVNVLPLGSGPDPDIIRVNWVQDGEPQHLDLHVG